MADNYLEKKMDDYRRGSLRAAPRVRSAATPYWRMPRLRVFVGGEVGEQASAVVGRLVACGCRVAFCDDDLKRGRALAQSSGALHLPLASGDEKSLRCAFDMVVERWGGIDSFLITRESGLQFVSNLEFPDGVPMRVVALNCPSVLSLTDERFSTVGVSADTGCDVAAVANLCCFLMAPDNRSVCKQIIRVMF